MRKFNLIIIIISLLFLNFCKKDEDKSIIEPDFQEYVNRFVTEAKLRNITIDMSNLKVRYGDTLKSVCGLGMPNDVLIRYSCWNNLIDSYKEILLFHELGHGVFGRQHNNQLLPNGDFSSIMVQDHLDLYSESTPEKRKYYLDKLFIPTTPIPAWAEQKTQSTILFTDTIQSGSPAWKFVNGPENTFTGIFCSTQYFSIGTSLSIEPSNSLDGWAYWDLDYVPEGINQSDKLVLSARIKTIGVTKGGGVTLLMGGRDVNNNRVFFTFKTDSGTMNFTEWKAEVPYYVSSKIIYIRFVLDRSQGITYLDDVTLTKFE